MNALNFIDFLSKYISALQKDLANTGWTVIISTYLDILLVTAAIYWLIMLSKRTRAWHVIWGLVIFLALVPLTNWLRLQTLNFLLRSLLPLGPVAIVLLFYPELRHLLENMGRMAGWGGELNVLPKDDVSELIKNVVRATCRMSERQIGALIVIERENSLDDICATGTRLDADVSESLMGSIFYPGGPLHDGAIVIKGSRVVAAGCTLPLSESAHIGTMIHTRHKAALGVAEVSDAAVVVVSEETGTISFAFERKLYRDLNENTLTEWLDNVTGISSERMQKSDFARKVNGTLKKAGLKRK